MHKFQNSFHRIALLIDADNVSFRKTEASTGQLFPIGYYILLIKGKHNTEIYQEVILVQKKTVVIADTDTKFLKELESELAKRDVYHLIGTASNGEQAIQLVKPDILIMDLLLPQYDRISVLDSISGMYNNCKIFVVTGFISNYIISALADRQISVLRKEPCSAQCVVDQIREKSFLQ